MEFELIYYHYSYFVAQRDAIDQIFVNVGSCQSFYEDTNTFFDDNACLEGGGGGEWAKDPNECLLFLEKQILSLSRGHLKATM